MNTSERMKDSADKMGIEKGKAYHRPTLKVYGRLTDITQADETGDFTDGAAGYTNAIPS